MNSLRMSRPRPTAKPTGRLVGAWLHAVLAQALGTQALAVEAPCVNTQRAVTVAAVGDVLLHDSYQRWASRQPQGYWPSLQPLKPVLELADVAVANLEGPAAAGVAPGGVKVSDPKTLYDGLVYKGYPLFNFHPSIIDDLKTLGIDVLQTGNNHSMDRGEVGANATIEAIEARGLHFTGTRHSQRQAQPWHALVRVSKAGKDYGVALLACSYGVNGMPNRARQVLLCHEQREEVLRQIRHLSSQPDIHAVIAMPHWGQEYQPLPDTVQKNLARDMAAAGATAIIGTHPHVVQPIETLQTADGRQVTVAYSLGNFVSHQIGLPRLTSFVLLLALEPDAQGRLAAQATGWVPIRMKTGPAYSVDPLDQLPPQESAPHREHLLRTLPASTLHAPHGPLWAGRECRR